MSTSLASVFLISMPGLGEWIVIGLVVFIFFGAAKLPQLGKGLGEGIRNFKKGLKGDAEEAPAPPKSELAAPKPGNGAAEEGNDNQKKA